MRTASGTAVTQALIDEGVATSEGVARMLAVRHHLPVIDLPSVGVAVDAVQLIPVQTLERSIAIPYAVEDDVLRVAVADPGNLHAIDELRLATKHSLDLGVASRDDIVAELQRLVRTAEAIGSVVAVEMDEEDSSADDLEVDDGISDGPLVRLVNALIFQAAEENASDVHFEALEDALAIRFRVDGVLREVQRIPKKMAAGVTTRLKVLAKLDIAERRKPQDGRITLSSSLSGECSTFASRRCRRSRARRSCMRLLDKSRKPPRSRARPRDRCARAPGDRPAADGMLARHRPDRLRQDDDAVRRARATINRPEINVITVEDPVEYRLAGVNQVRSTSGPG